VRFGVAISGAPDPAFPEEMAELESAGFDSLWFGLDGTGWDPIVLASAAAEATMQAKLVIALADPTPVTGKSVASLDALSGGRVRVLVETGDAVGLLRAMLGGGRVSYADARFRVVDAPVLPAPVQDRVPIWTRIPDLVPIVDGWLATSVDEVGAVAFSEADLARLDRAVLIEETTSSSALGELAAEVRRLGVEEIILKLDRTAWRSAAKVLAEIK